MSDKDTKEQENIGYSAADQAPAQTDEGKIATSPETLKGILERLNRVIDTEFDQVNTRDATDRRTQFDELVTASETNTFALQSEWNALELRNETKTTGDGSVSNNSKGEYEIKTGGSGSAEITSNEAGRYSPGTTAILGLGIRSLQEKSEFSSGDEAEWGLFNEDSGIGYGIDDQDFYVFYTRNGTKNKIYRSNFSHDPLDGTGPSGFEIDHLETFIFNVSYTHYGSGSIAWHLSKRTEAYDKGVKNRQLLHVYDPTADSSYQGPSIPQPSLPFTVRVSGEDIGLGLTGRSFRRLDQGGTVTRREPVESVVDYSGLTQNTWEPVYTFTKKSTFNNFINEIGVRFKDVDVTADEDISVRVELGNDLVDETNTTYSGVEQWDGNSCVESAKGNNITLNSGAEGFLVGEEIIRGAGSSGFFAPDAQGDASIQTSAPIGKNDDVVILVRQDTGNTTTVSVTTAWTEAH